MVEDALRLNTGVALPMTKVNVIRTAIEHRAGDDVHPPG